MVQVLPGDERIIPRSALCLILSQTGFFHILKAAAYYLIWGKGSPIAIHHYRDVPELGGAYPDVLELPFATLHSKFPELKELLNETKDDEEENVDGETQGKCPTEWQVYRHCIEEDPNVDPEFDVVHTYINTNVHGGSKAEEYYDGHQYIIAERFQEDYDEQSGKYLHVCKKMQKINLIWFKVTGGIFQEIIDTRCNVALVMRLILGQE
jgi:hypothetical protein